MLRIQRGMREWRVSCKTLVCLFLVSNSFLSFLRVYKVPSAPPLCYFLPKEKEKGEPHSRHMLSAWGEGRGGRIKRQEAHPEEAGFSAGQGLGRGNAGGTKPLHFLPQSLNAG